MTQYRSKTDFSRIHLKDSIAARLLKVVFSIYVGISISLTALHMSSEYRNTKKEVRRELEALYQIIRMGLTNAFYDADLFQVHDILEGMATSPSILGCKLVDSMGNTVEKSGTILGSGGNSLGAAAGESGYHEDEETGFFFYRFPIIHAYEAQQIRMGTLSIYSGRSVIFRKVRYGFVLIVVNAIIKTIALWIIFLYFSRNMLGRPLAILTAATKGLKPDNLQDLEVDVGTRGRNELKLLEEAFNTMVRNLNDAHERRIKAEKILKGFNEKLKQEVDQRTAELRKANLHLKQQQEMLERLAVIDGLTEIPNRRKFDEVLDTEWRRAERAAEPVALILMDIDHFKGFNDYYGHASGDECLRKVAQGLACSLGRASDFLARYGGEEFAVILPCASAESATEIAEKIRGNIESLNIPHAASQVSDHVTLSLGIALLVPSREASPRNLIERADHALYRAKTKGRNRVECAENGREHQNPGLNTR